MDPGEPAEQQVAAPGERQQHPAVIGRVPPAAEQTAPGQPVHQAHRALMAELEPLGDVHDGGAFASGNPLHREQQLVLPGLEAGGAGGLLAPPEEPAELVAERGEGADLGGREAGHPANYIVSRYNSSMPTMAFQLPVRITAGDGHRGGEGTVDVGTPTFRTRLRSAALIFLAGAVIGVLLLPVPLIHLFGIMFFLGMTGLAARRLIARRVFLSAEGRCPSCGTTGPLFVGLGTRRFALPVVTACERCGVELTLEGTVGG